ncbi:MAG: hypothetical protein NVS3B21_15630 [Acidimicrobiales bacterium]
MRRVVMGALLSAIFVFAGTTPAIAEPPAGSAPTIILDHNKVRPGEKMIVMFNDWQSRSATVGVCGNLARRGSTDCDLVNGQGVSLAIGAPRMITEFVVTLPPVPCPCVVEAWNTAHTEVAFAPLEIIGAPVSAVVSPSSATPLALSVRVVPAPKGIVERVRAGLGGSTAYDVTVSLRNQSQGDLSDISIDAIAGRSSTDITKSFDVAPPRLVAVGQTWTRHTRVTLPVLSLHAISWEVTASGSGPTIHALAVTRETPWGLAVAGLILVTDVSLIVGRRARRGRRSQERPSEQSGQLPRLRVVRSDAA